MSSIGSSTCSSHGTKSDEHDDRDRERAERRRRCAQPLSGASMSPYTSDDDADDRQHRADRVELRLLGVPRLRDEELARDERDRR